MTEERTLRVIGISGLHGSIEFKTKELPGLTRSEYRITQGLDSAAALVTPDGVVAAAAEERFTGEKTTGAFPVNAIRFCLEQGGITMDDVDFVAHGFDYRPTAAHGVSAFTRRRFRQVYDPAVQRARLRSLWPRIDWERRFLGVPHHVAHAASSFHLSGFDEALVLVADGMGEVESLSVGTGRGTTIEFRHTISAMHSLGTFYGAVTLYLGFVFGMDEYKVMGLAPCGDPDRYLEPMRELVRLGPGGTFTVPALAANRGWREHETLAGTLRLLVERFGPARSPADPIDQRHMDVAAAAQAVLESALAHVCRHFRDVTGLRRLCYAGGVALNCSFNGKLAESGLFDEIFVQPAAGDDGSSLGAALHTYHTRSRDRERRRMAMPYWGPEYGTADIEDALRESRLADVARYSDFAELAKNTAALLADGQVVAWFQDRMEFGPRALGNRSILADPRDAAMRDKINSIIKQREEFRPFAPVVRIEDATEYFEIAPGSESQFAHMLFVARTRERYQHVLRAVTHVDGTARVQVVRREENEKLWRLLTDFGGMTGVPVLLNTSFNLRGQPIVMDPRTAVTTFLNSRLDYLVLGHALLSRPAPAEFGDESPRL